MPKPKKRKTESLSPRQETLHGRWREMVDPIHSEWLARTDKGVSPYDRKSSYLKRELYRVIRSLLERADGDATIRAAVAAERKKEPQTPGFKENQFSWGLKAAAEQFGLGNDRISRMASEMKYAYAHDIPPHLLIGFIHQIGAAVIHSRSPTTREPWFENTKKMPCE